MKTLFIASTSVILIISVYWIIPFVIKRIIKSKFLKRAHGSQFAYITFDDGPDPSSTPHILDLLEKNHALASFFIVASKAERYPDLVQKILYGGHAIGEHGYAHIHPWKSGPLKSVSDIMKASRVFNSSIFPAAPIFYRPPYGKYNIVSLLYYATRKKMHIFWDIDSEDYKQSDPNAVADNVFHRIKPGSVILLHDGRQNGKLSPAMVTIKALGRILESASDMGLQFKTMNDLFRNEM